MGAALPRSGYTACARRHPRVHLPKPAYPPGAEGQHVGIDPLDLGDGRRIPRRELTVRASRAGGPGGQHVNTSSTRIEVVWNVDETPVLSPDERRRLRQRLASRIDSAGNLRVVASSARSQHQNRDAAESRLAKLVTRALTVAPRRRPTLPTAASVRKRLETKRRLSDKKRERRAGRESSE